MKVLCIDDKIRAGDIDHGWTVKEFETYTVVGSFFCDEINMNCFELKEDPMNWKYGWDEDRFIPLSKIDETEMIREYNLQKA